MEVWKCICMANYGARWVPDGFFLLMVNFYQFHVNLFSSLTRLLITYVWFAVADRERDRDRDYVLSRKTSSVKSFQVFFNISSLFLYELFSWPKSFILDEKISLPKSLPTKHVFRRPINLCLKKIKNDIPLGDSSNVSEY